MSAEHRRGAEFSPEVRRRVFARARGKCMHPEGCTNPHNGTVDHITGPMLGRLLGMDKKTLKSVDNAQTLCIAHDEFKTRYEERYFILQREWQLLGGEVHHKK